MDPVQAHRGQAVVPQSTLDPPEPRQPIYIEDYEIIRLLGKGSFGSVYIVRSRRDPTKMCVMKKISVHNLSEWPLATTARSCRLLPPRCITLTRPGRLLLRGQPVLFGVLEPALSVTRRSERRTRKCDYCRRCSTPTLCRTRSLSRSKGGSCASSCHSVRAATWRRRFSGGCSGSSSSKRRMCSTGSCRCSSRSRHVLQVGLHT